MAHRILIPTPLRPFAGKQDVVEVEGGTVGDALQGLVGQYGDLRRHLYNDDGRLRSFVNIYVNDEDIRHLDRETDGAQGGRHDQHRAVGRRRVGRGRARGRGADARRSPALQPAPHHAGGRHRRAAQAQGGARALRRRRRARVRRPSMYLAAAGVGTLGLVDFDVVDASNLHRQIIYGTPDVGQAEAGSLARAADGDESGREGRHARGRADVEERARRAAGLRRRSRRHGQFSDPLSGQRRVRAARQAERLRQHLPLRRPGVRLRRQGRAVLPLPVSGAAAARARAELRRRWRARRAARRHRHHPGDRSDQADSRRRPAARRPAAALRCAADAFSRAEAAARSRVPDLRRSPDDPRAHRLRRSSAASSRPRRSRRRQACRK